MLTDTARKILRMLDAHRYVPSVAELARKAGRTTDQVKEALRELREKKHIEYDPGRHSELKIVLAWETDLQGKVTDPRMPQVRHELWESF